MPNVKTKELNEEPKNKPYKASKAEQDVLDFLSPRIEILKDTKKSIVGGLNFEEIMRSADREYQPRFLDDSRESETGSYLVEDDRTGLRGSRLVKASIDSEDWRSDVSEPTLLVKVQTALSILIDQNPEAQLKATSEKYEARTLIAKALWKRNWEINDSIETLKLFTFDLAKYGWAVGHTVPRIIKRKKLILDEVDIDNPENNKYKEIEIIDFNDVYREKLDPYRTWLDDNANLSDKFSVNDWYYEKDYSKDDFLREFGKYKNSESVVFNSVTPSDDNERGNDENKTRKDMVTVGFYENKSKDLYTIYIQDQGIILYYSPLPNDDGKLTVWWTYWAERDPRTIYGIGLYEMLKHNKVLYDRFKNMTVDQLTMAIYPMIFYSGTPQAGDNEMTIAPNRMIQKLPSTQIDQLKIDYDPRGWEAVAQINNDMDEVTGITKTLQGEITGKTLGETLQAKDSALKRLSIPLANIAKAIEEDAYITLSWANQVYSIPEVKSFLNVEELALYEKEFNKKAKDVTATKDGKLEADFYQELDLGLAEDREGELEESLERRFFKLGEGKLPLEAIKWEGKINIKARSIVSPNPELERQRKLEIYNIVLPVIQMMQSALKGGADKEGNPIPPDTDMAVALYKPTKEILEIQDEKPKDWLPDAVIQLAENPEIKEEADKAQQEKENPLMIDENEMGPGGPQGGQQAPPAPGSVVPQSQVTNQSKDILRGNNKAVNG